MITAQALGPQWSLTIEEAAHSIGTVRHVRIDCNGLLYDRKRCPVDTRTASKMLSAVGNHLSHDECIRMDALLTGKD